MCHLSVPNILLDSLGGMFAERGKTVRKADVVLAVSISPYANEVAKLVVVQERKVPMIVITDSDLNLLAPFSDVCMEVRVQRYLVFEVWF